MIAIVLGATGATGKELVQLLLQDETYKGIKVFVRKSVGISNEKLKEYIVDFDEPENWKREVTGDVLFSVMGTTLQQAGSKENQWKIDHDIPLAIAKMARENDVKSCALVTALGSDANSRIFYSRMKGTLEQATKNLAFPQLIIFRPAGLIRPKSDRGAENMSVKVVQFLNAIGLFRKYRPLPVQKLAQAMINSVGQLPFGTHIISADEIFKWIQK